MIKSVKIDFADELLDILKRFDYILGQYESEGKDEVKPFRKIEKDFASRVAVLQEEMWND